jgi:hypothetical protein
VPSHFFFSAGPNLGEGYLAVMQIFQIRFETWKGIFAKCRYLPRSAQCDQSHACEKRPYIIASKNVLFRCFFIFFSKHSTLVCLDHVACIWSDSLFFLTRNGILQASAGYPVPSAVWPRADLPGRG